MNVKSSSDLMMKQKIRNLVGIALTTKNSHLELFISYLPKYQAEIIETQIGVDLTGVCRRGSCLTNHTSHSLFNYKKSKMQEAYFKYNRKSHVEIGTVYFWTATINKWQLLLKDDEYKEIIIQSLEHLSSIQKIDVFAFVIMPNHVHFIWRINENNPKETTVGSFMKFTAHEFFKKLKTEKPTELNRYRVSAKNKLHEFWQRDALAIPLYTMKVALQKLDYIHDNPIAEKWNLAKEPSDYKYSTALFYENNFKNHTFIKDLMEEF